MEVGRPGMERTIGRKLEEENLEKGETYWSRFFFQRIMVPPFALDLTRGSSGSFRSSELRKEEYSPLKRFIANCWSHWKSWGSLKKTRSGE